jgi:hypothetical protein
MADGGERAPELSAFRREAVSTAGLDLDDAGLAQLGEPAVQHARRHRIAALTQQAKGERPAAELPKNA